MINKIDIFELKKILICKEKAKKLKPSDSSKLLGFIKKYEKNVELALQLSKMKFSCGGLYEDIVDWGYKIALTKGHKYKWDLQKFIKLSGWQPVIEILRDDMSIVSYNRQAEPNEIAKKYLKDVNVKEISLYFIENV